MARPRLNAARLLGAIAAVAAVAAVSVGVGRATPSFAAPDTVRVASETPDRDTTSAGPASVSVLTTQSAIPVDGTFTYQASVRTDGPAEFIQARMRLFMPETRTLVFQKTFIEPAPTTGSVSFTFSRTIADIDLEPGAYPVEISWRVVVNGTSHEAVQPMTLLVYEKEKAPLKVAIVARVSALPLTGPDGTFTSDPAEFTRARDDVDALCTYVLADPEARLTLALPPMMLEEWRRVSKGYRYEGPEGETEQGPDSQVAQAYTSTLQRLRAAMMSGRLELTSTGYSDPSLSELAAAGLLADIAPQYQLGASTCFAAVEATPSAGTAPAGGSMSEAAGKALAAQEISYTVVRSKWSRTGAKAARPGAYRARGSALRVLVSDDAAVRALTSSPTAEAVIRTYEHHRDTTGAPLPLSVAVGPEAASADAVTDFARTISAQPWADLVVAADAASVEKPERVRLLGSPADKDAPEGHWSTVSEGRRWARALGSSLGSGADEVAAAERDSLAAEASAWVGVSGEWERAEGALAYAASAERVSRDILKRITMSAKAVTLAGTKGEVPITIVNRTGRTVKVKLVTLPSPGMRLGTRSTRYIELQPQENFVEVPVDLMGGLSGSLRVRLLADEVELAETTVALKASIIDKLVLLAGIVLVLVGLLSFIITKVRAAESRDTHAGGGGRRYT